MIIPSKKKQNCWEVLQCGREPGGVRTEESGVCPAAAESTYNGYNNGSNAGRYCWRVAGTLCADKVHGDFADKVCVCGQCRFFLQVVREEGKDFHP